MAFQSQSQSQDLIKIQGFLSAVKKEERSELEKKLKHIKKDFLVDVISYLVGEMDPKALGELVGESKEQDVSIFEECGDVVGIEEDSQVQSQKNQSQSQNSKVKEDIKKERKTCSFYLRGICRHGKRGEECQFYHPKICFKYKKSGKEGCQRGNSCKYAHVTFCKKEGCQVKECKFGYHLDERSFKKPQEASQKPLQFCVSGMESKKEEYGLQSQGSSQYFLESLQKILHQTISEAMRSFITSQSQF